MNIIVKPIITEKMTKTTEKFPNRFGFIVDKRANKIEIKRAVEELYGVKVESVNTMNYSGKNKSRYTKSGFIQGRTAAFKKAIVMLAEGDTIDFFSNI
ncbi:MAG: 50S ribosomal protein L23 [Bacteroidales bacterium]|jgi:large subunit ribosomal protein L23|nr:50S ribosomal protein L23 [Bacteroidales bacterium]MBQ2397662.1 50S ribosomal protein L23 [Bacteroidales bacterium]MBQ5873754.1 50S ribosomal protein L23 [Bacteroidales bacterium]MBQ5892271.1 50S ribosomal protein L23 [Bacteroidales bacterium]MED9962830.1 50S ribosomal protein L23 [Bacteroidales bacterium]